MNIYVGNLPFKTNEDSVRQLFEQYGEVSSVKLITDRDTGRPKGFGFIEMEDSAGARAIQNLNDSQLDDRNIKVNEARDRAPAGNRRF